MKTQIDQDIENVRDAVSRQPGCPDKTCLVCRDNADRSKSAERVIALALEHGERAALVEQIKEAQRQRDEEAASLCDTLAALGAAEADAAVWRRRTERAEAAISEAVRELREQLQPNSTAARGDDSSTGEGRDSAPADGTR